MIQNYGKIGKAVLKRLLGLQQDGYIYSLDSSDQSIDPLKSGCLSCPYHILSQNSSDQKTLEYCTQQCATCKTKIIAEPDFEKKYIYEKSKYGYSKPMYLNSIKVFLYIHLFGYDSKSFVRDLDLKEVSSYLDVDIKTIRRALLKLRDFDYIYTTNVSEPLVNILLPEADSYAQVGGSGYFELSKALFDELIQITNINSFRITLRTLLEFDESYAKGQEKDILKKRIHDIHKYLPQYAKPHIILDCIQKAETIFETVSDKKIVQFHIKEQFKTKQQHQLALKETAAKLNDFVENFNQDVDKLNKRNLRPEESTYASYFIDPPVKTTTYPYLFFHSSDCEKIATIFIKYDMDFARRVLTKIYRQSLITDLHIKNPEAYIRTSANNLKKEDLFEKAFYEMNAIA